MALSSGALKSAVRGYTNARFPLMTIVASVDGIHLNPPAVVQARVAHYHDKPRDKVKLAAQWARQHAEKTATHKKYEPFKEPLPMDDVLSIIRQQRASHAEENLVEPAESKPTGGLLEDTVTDPYRKPQRKCILCEHNIPLDYKNARLLSQFISPYTGQILGAHVTGLCVPMQRRVSQLIKRARRLGLIPIIQKDPRYLDDPSLFNQFKPTR